MTRRIVRLADDKGRDIFVELPSETELDILFEEKPDGEDSPYAPVGSPATAEQFQNSLGDLIRNTAGKVLDAMNSLPPASKVAIEFHAELGFEGKVWFLASLKSNSSVKITVEWEGKEQEK